MANAVYGLPTTATVTDPSPANVPPPSVPTRFVSTDQEDRFFDVGGFEARAQGAEFGEAIDGGADPVEPAHLLGE